MFFLQSLLFRTDMYESESNGEKYLYKKWVLFVSAELSKCKNIFVIHFFFFSYLPHGSQQYFLFLSFFCQVPSPLVVSELINGARIDDYDDDVRRLILCNPNAPYCLYTPNHGALPLTEEDTTSRYLLSFIFLSLFLLNVLFFVLLSSFFLFFCRHELPLQCTQMPIPR